MGEHALRGLCVRLGAGSFDTSRPVQSYLTQSVFKVVLQKSIPTQTRHILREQVIVKDTLTDLCGS